MLREFRQIEWDDEVEGDLRALVRLAVREDLDRSYDWTTAILVSPDAWGKGMVRARKGGVVAGIPAGGVVAQEYDRRLRWTPLARDGETLGPGGAVAELAGPARSLLAAERPLLNLLGRLSGIATLTRRFVEAVAGSRARIFDTRKTTPGCRRLEKYAVRVGGGHNHRTGLFDGILIKDNHLALSRAELGASPAQAVAQVREFLGSLPEGDPRSGLVVAVEVDTLEQLAGVLPAGPDVVLVDNAAPAALAEAVALRDRLNPSVLLEASGGIGLENVAQIAASGVDRISVGALTHSAAWLDVGLDWI